MAISYAMQKKVIIFKKGATTFSRTTINIMDLLATYCINETYYNNAQFRYAHCLNMHCYAECRYA
jgi:hypothetical protein